MARILCVEDNVPNMRLMTYLLRKFGHSPVEAPDGPSSLALLRDGRPDLVLMDLAMPGMSGVEVLGKIRAEESLRTLPVVAVTAFAMVGDREYAIAAGFDGYIAKPLNPQTFVEQVEAFLPRHLWGETPETVARAAPLLGPAAPPTGKTVLVVDDILENIHLFRNILEHAGYRVLAAAGMSAALQAVRRDRPDMIVSDVHMPGGSGLDLLAALRADPETGDIPVGLATWSGPGPEARRRAEDDGAVFFLDRPVEPGMLLERIEAVLAEER